jgi:hypothetical protein
MPGDRHHEVHTETSKARTVVKMTESKSERLRYETRLSMQQKVPCWEMLLALDKQWSVRESPVC